MQDVESGDEKSKANHNDLALIDYYHELDVYAYLRGQSDIGITLVRSMTLKDVTPPKGETLIIEKMEEKNGTR